MSYNSLDNVDNQTLDFSIIDGESYPVWDLVVNAIENCGLPDDIIEGAVASIHSIHLTLERLLDAFESVDDLRGVQIRDDLTRQPAITEKYSHEQILEYIDEAEDAQGKQYWLAVHDIPGLIEDMDRYFTYRDMYIDEETNEHTNTP